jgi:hypothetical protein
MQLLGRSSRIALQALLSPEEAMLQLSELQLPQLSQYSSS